jgi:putative membrane protein
MMWGWNGGGGWGVFGAVMMVFFLLAIVVGVVLIIRALTGDQSRAPVDREPATGARPAETGTARRILEERYARGEIDREEFLRRREDLGG